MRTRCSSWRCPFVMRLRAFGRYLKLMVLTPRSWPTTRARAAAEPWPAGPSAPGAGSAAAGGRSTPYTYSWYGTGVSGGGKTQVVFPAATQQYTVVLWDGCALKSDTAIQTIYVKPPLSVKIIQADTAVCISDTMFLAAKASGGDTAGYKYQWSNGMGTSNLASIILTDTLKVYLTLTDGCTVVSAVDSARLDTYLPLMLSVSNDTMLCQGRTADLGDRRSRTRSARPTGPAVERRDRGGGRRGRTPRRGLAREPQAA